MVANWADHFAVSKFGHSIMRSLSIPRVSIFWKRRCWKYGAWQKKYASTEVKSSRSSSRIGLGQSRAGLALCGGIAHHRDLQVLLPSSPVGDYKV